MAQKNFTKTCKWESTHKTYRCKNVYFCPSNINCWKSSDPPISSTRSGVTFNILRKMIGTVDIAYENSKYFFVQHVCSWHKCTVKKSRILDIFFLITYPKHGAVINSSVSNIDVKSPILFYDQWFLVEAHVDCLHILKQPHLSLTVHTIGYIVRPNYQPEVVA